MNSSSTAARVPSALAYVSPIILTLPQGPDVRPDESRAAYSFLIQPSKNPIQVLIECVGDPDTIRRLDVRVLREDD